MTTQRAFSAEPFTAKCIKECGTYKKDTTYKVYVDNVFTPIPLTEEAPAQQKGEGYKAKFSYPQKGRKSIFNYHGHSPDAGYIIFDSEEKLKEHFELMPFNT